MWCECCRADVAAELSLDHRRFSCTRCGTDLGYAAGSSSRPGIPRLADSERDARELLARWSALSVLEPLQHATVVEAEIAAPGPTLASTVRVDRLKESPEASAIVTPHAESNRAAESERKRRRKQRRREIAPRDAGDPVTATASVSTSSWPQLAGHLAAYGGVGLLSVGMTLVIWSYFGGPPAYAPTGWLLTTVGQMLLYLGVVTLVASGLEQTTDAVTLQMRQMGDKLERLEAASRRERRATVSLRDAA